MLILNILYIYMEYIIHFSLLFFSFFKIFTYYWSQTYFMRTMEEQGDKLAEVDKVRLIS